MNNRIDEIRNIINKEFDGRMEASVFSYILEKGIEDLSELTEEKINKIEGNGFMTANFLQSLVRTAVKICKTYSPMEIMEYIRVVCNFAPFTREQSLYREDFAYSDWRELCNVFDGDLDGQEIKILLIEQ